jgi:cellulose synthase/poly-beta-1,6-N-acetylglucosamine synthase-like glycosyltransferase
MAMTFWIVPLLILLNLMLVPAFLLKLAWAIAALASGRKGETATGSRTRFMVVIPAHDEEVGIGETVRSCLAVEYPEALFEVVVIADNCSDETANVARGAGARVVERHDPSRRSKGYAIEYLIDQLHDTGQFDKLDAVVLIDADTTVSRDLLSGLAAEVESGEDWIQCLYAVSNPEASWRTRLMDYAFSLFNGIVPLGQSALGCSAGLRGNGMCFSTRGLRRVPWNSYGLVEDFEYSWTVRIAGGKIAFLPWVAVRGVMPEQGGTAAIAQRRRWEYGRRDMSLRMLFPLLRTRRLDAISKLAAVIELMMPPMVAILIWYLVLVAANILVVVLTSPPAFISLGLLGSAALMTLSLALYALAPFFVFEIPWGYLSIAFYLPAYAIWKLLTSLHGRPTTWVRTPREQTINQ